jgi:hypothetical protein
MRLAYRQKPPVDRAAEEIELAFLHGGYSLDRLARRQQAAGATAAAAAAAAAGATAGAAREEL